MQQAKFNVLSRDTRWSDDHPKDYASALSFELKLSGTVGSPSNEGYTSVITAKSNGDLRAVGTYQIGGDHPFELDLPTRYLIVGIVLREAVSIIENLAAVTQLIPSWFVDKLRHMDQKGDMQCFKEERKDAKD